MSALGLWAGRTLSPQRQDILCAAAMALGAAFGFGAAVALATLYDVHLILAAIVNIAGQAILAILAVLRLAGRVGGAPARTARDTSDAVRALLTRARLPALTGTFEDIAFLFVWTAAVMQLLLVFDPRYREFPVSTFAVPLVVTIGRFCLRDVPRTGGGVLEILAGGTLVIGAIASAIQEGPLNGQSLLWNACAMLLAAPAMWRVRKEAVLF